MQTAPRESPDPIRLYGSPAGVSIAAPMTASGHFRPINDVCAMSAFHPFATELLHYGK